MSRRVLVILAAVLLCTVAACGSSGDDASQASKAAGVKPGVPASHESGASATTTATVISTATTTPAASAGQAIAVSFTRPENATEDVHVDAGLTFGLISCDGPYGTWSGEMRQGGIEQSTTGYTVSFSTFPVAFTMGDDGQVQATSSGVLRSSVGDSPRTYSLNATTDGETMTVIASEEDGYSNPFYDQFTNMPIVEGPPGACLPSPSPG